MIQSKGMNPTKCVISCAARKVAFLRLWLRGLHKHEASSLEEASMIGNITITVANTFPSVGARNEVILKQICVSQVTNAPSRGLRGVRDTRTDTSLEISLFSNLHSQACLAHRPHRSPSPILN
jgi:hypothetical protein